MLVPGCPVERGQSEKEEEPREEDILGKRGKADLA